MGTEILMIGVGILLLFAALDIVVGVSNDAVNFLTSSIGSGAASREVIMVIASLGILLGVTFSSGMMEVARKGIFNPQFLTMPDLIIIFLAVMLTDIILLDLFNTFGLPTSTTVSVVFELLGAAVAIAALKSIQAGASLLEVPKYINSGKAMIIIMGILLSVIVAFACGAIAQFLSRTLLTFDYVPRLRRYGALWGGVAMASITYFILVKGAKGASFLTANAVTWISTHTWTLLFAIFAVSAVVLQVLLLFRFNILKLIVLVGTFALALAFAANDLVNFVGVPLAGLHAYRAAMATENPLGATMEALSKKVESETSLLLIAGAIMVITLWVSKKARTVTETSLSLSQQEEGNERFESIFLSRAIVRLALNFFEFFKVAVPAPVRLRIDRRFDAAAAPVERAEGEMRARFDLVRAAVNLMVASAVVSYATSHKLPLSTTYVTFMVAMGSSFADKAWGRESAVYRVTGVLTVVGGWFLTAFMAFTISAVFASVIFYGHVAGVVVLFVLAGYLVRHTHRKHQELMKDSEDYQVFNLETVDDAPKAIEVTFEHMGILLREIRQSLQKTLDGLFRQDFYALGEERKKVKKVQDWANIITANIFKAMRQLQRNEMALSYKYAQTVRRIQMITDGYRDIVLRAYTHIGNHHKGLLSVQVEELRRVGELLDHILQEAESTLTGKQTLDIRPLSVKNRELRALVDELNSYQVERIRDESSKTRLTIMFYAIMGNSVMISRQTLRLLRIFERSFGPVAVGREGEGVPAAPVSAPEGTSVAADGGEEQV